MLECKIDSNLVRQNIEDHVGNMAVNTGLFERFDSQILIPIEDVAKKALSYKDELPSALYKNMMEADPIDFLKFVYEQIINTPITDESIEGTGLSTLPDGLILLAKSTFKKAKYEESKLPANVQYSLDAVDKLQSEKGQEVFEKGAKNNWDLNKILTELQLQKAQRELILTFGITSREAIISELLTNYSYPVEIKVASRELDPYDFPTTPDFPENGSFTLNGKHYEADFQTQEYWVDGVDNQITKEEYHEAEGEYLKSLEQTINKIPSSIYSNVTVPGGTNYRENNINTPDITPSIKGHAQFATDKGIGWFRSDDQQVLKDEASRQEEFDNSGFVVLARQDLPKTRRILEIQSDLFQKIRPKWDTYLKGWRVGGEAFSTLEDAELASKSLTRDLWNLGQEPHLEDDPFAFEVTDEEFKNLQKPNEFLQLLNKDNNWVTFFVKSIIQDSAKKGYEKVLFPSGNTASKVEGHQTLDEFIKQKQERLDRLKEHLKLDKELDVVEDTDHNGVFYRIYDPSTGVTKNGSYQTYQSANEAIDKEVEDRNREIAQIEAEIQRTQGPEGMQAFSSIANFYENAIQNVLKKRGYEPKRITDEYGNDWFEVDIIDFIKSEIEKRFGDVKSTSSHSEFAAQVNESFEEKIMTLTGNSYRITVPDSVINDVLAITLRANPQGWTEFPSELSQNVFDEEGVRKELGLSMTDTPLDFIEKYSIEKEQINKFLAANPGLKIEFSTGNSQFDPASNTVVVSLQEALISSKRTGIPFAQVVNFFIEHELAHAASVYAIETGANDQFIFDLLNTVRDYHTENLPFQDEMRQGAIDGKFPYSMKDKHEFVADAFSNPYFQEYLKSIPYKKSGMSIWEKLIDWIRGILGFQQDSIYDVLTRYINSEAIVKDNIEGSMTPWVQPMSIVYKVGTPKNYIDATYDMFVREDIKDQIEKIFKNLPAAMIKLKVALDVETNEDKRKRIQSLLDAYKEVKGNEKVVPVYINMLVTASQIARDLNSQLLAIDKLSEDKKIHAAYGIYISAKNLEFIAPLVNDVLDVLDKVKYGPDVNRFVTQLRGITSITQKIDYTFTNIVSPLLQKYYSSLNPESQALKQLEAEYKDFKEKAETTGISENAKRLYESKMKEKREDMMRIASPASFQAVFSGKYPDAVASQMNLEAIYMNSHPLIATVASKMKDLDIEISQEVLNTENEHQRKLDKIVKDQKLSLRDPSKTWDEIMSVVKFTKSYEENDKGELVPTIVETKMFQSSYSPEYLEKHFELQAKKDFYYRKYLENKEERYYDLYQSVLREQNIFQRENSELRYTSQVYDMYDLMDREITRPDNTKTSFRKERGDIFREIEDLEHKRDSSTDMDFQKLYQDMIAQKYIEMREIRSMYDSAGKDKTGLELELAIIANEYYKLRNEYGQYVLTPEGQASFEREKADIEERFKNNYISEKQRDALLNSITVTEVDDEYSKQLDQISDALDVATGDILKVPEIAKIFSPLDRTKLKEGYKRIRQLTYAFRDNEGVIDGILFSKTRADLVLEIKAIQEETEKLKEEASRLKGLSITETIRIKELNARGGTPLSPEEQSELETLRRKATEISTAYKNNKVLIDEYYNLLSKMSAMTKSSISTYYFTEQANQLNSLIQSEKESLKREMLRAPVLEGGLFYKRNDIWYKVISKNENTGEQVVSEIKDDTNYSAKDKVIDEVAKIRADKKLLTTEWWRNNHYNRHEFDPETKSYYDVEVPIYIWVKTAPTDATLINKGQPSIKFKTYKVYDGATVLKDGSRPNYYNPNFKEIYPWIPINKRGKFENKDYASITPDMRDYLEFLRKEYHGAQEMYPLNKRMGDLLPGIVKTNEELRVETTNNLAKWDTYKNLIGFLGKADESEDSKLLLGGSQSRFYSSRRVLPTRFTDKLDKDTQSSNVPGMILTFIVSANKYAKYSEIHPILEATRIVVESLPVQEQVSFASKFNLRGIVNAIKSDTKKITREKDVDVSTLSKSMDYLINTFFYEERKNSSITQIAGMNVDWQKFSQNLKRFSSLSIFTANMFAAVKNTGSAKAQSIINSNYGKGFYTNVDYVAAQGEMFTYMKDFATDYKKFGDKSKIGQALQYFQVMHGTIYNEYGQKTQWTELKNLPQYLTWFKNSSEFELQVTQFLAMSRANKVKLGDRMVPLFEAYEIDKDGNFAKKSGAEISPEFEKAFIKKLAYINRMINGAYREDERNALQKTVLGDLAFYLNGYVMPAITNRYAGTRYSIEADAITKGYWKQATLFIRDLAKYRAGLNTTWETLNAEEKGRVMRFLKEMSFVVAFMILVAVLGGGDDKDDLRKNSPFHNYLLAQLMAIKSDTETFVPLPSMGFNELSRKINSPFVALRQITNVLKVLQNSVDYVIGDSDAFYKKRGVQDGFHDKGDPKVVANFLKLIGWSGTAFDPLEKVYRTKQLQEIR